MLCRNYNKKSFKIENHIHGNIGPHIINYKFYNMWALFFRIYVRQYDATVQPCRYDWITSSWELAHKELVIQAYL